MFPSNASTAPEVPPATAPLSIASPTSWPVITAPAPDVTEFWKARANTPDVSMLLRYAAPSFIKSRPGICDPANDATAPLIALSRSAPLATFNAKLAAICSGIDNPPVAIARPI